LERAGRPLNFLDKELLLSINRRVIAFSGGHFFEGSANLLNESSLDYILEAVKFPVFQVEIFPSIIEKAAALCWYIISDHIFFDGNKRTGILSTIIFLEENGYTFDINRDVIDIAVAIACGAISFKEFVAWLNSKVNIVG
jgi:death on curing protein